MNELKLKRVVLATTLKCNLLCKLCFPKAPQLKKPWHPDTDYLKAEIDRIFSVIDGCERLDLSGGEPLLRKDIGEIVRYVMHYANRMDNGIRLITNAAVAPGGDFLDVCKEHRDKIEVLVDNYGESVSVHLRHICQSFDDCGIRYDIRNNDPTSPHCGGWVDLGIERGKRNDENTAKALFKNCICANELRYAGAIEAGRQYACKMSKLVCLAGWEEENPSEFVDYMDTSKSREQLRKELKGLYNRDSVAACQYCDGFFDKSPRFAPGEQFANTELREAMRF